MMRRLCVAVILAIGCFELDPNRRFSCDDVHGCPPGQSCVNGLCAAPQDDASTGPVDLSAQADLATGECVGSGYPVGGKGVWACLGTFSPARPASSLCRNRICTDISALVSPADCTAMSNPVIGVAGNGQGAFNAKCATAAGPNLLIYGCGNRKKPTLAEIAATPCRGYTMVHYQNSDGLQYNSLDYSMDRQTNLDPSGGVLCCPP